MMWYLNDVICDFNKNVSKFNVSSENTGTVKPVWNDHLRKINCPERVLFSDTLLTYV